MTVTTIVTDSSTSEVASGLLAIYLPETWSVDSVYSDSYGCSEPFEISGESSETWPNTTYPSEEGYRWYVASTSEGDSLTYYVGEVGQAIVTITPSDSLGIFQLAFQAAVFHSPGHIYFEGVPCSCMVAVTPLNLDQEIWGHIKAEF